MRKKLVIEHIEMHDQQLWLISTEPPFSLEGAKAKHYMLTDSDHLAFIYILEVNDEFVYVTIPQSLWKDLKAVLSGEFRVFLQSGTMRLELPQFKEELAYLLENIEGNANYGEEMEKAVKEIFLT
ncbi:UPF0738 family protein [Thermaerobacillus caldiproteolyticus]|uniref:UPF0738 protein HNR31_001714 n=1 Tax=Thermaerobacillus caldiproteolyticus TaxID=247480 RepID=A0A7W0BYG5_9BACL|nr:hypothetical protein [Anoxybacillus caldiproteolyticus]MBA2874943.1 hypothetical protein [Anoxybacillus caldiproteolyticus]QPA31741.1 hypothetical protein ISX45_01630 [Anoxybacillus caldiproteolyticus]